MITQDAAERKALPITSGVLDYFPDALLEVAHCSKVGNDQHNAGQPLHWAKEKSTDEADALVRHLLERGTMDTDGVRHSAKVAWRALAMLQREIDAETEEAKRLELGRERQRKLLAGQLFTEERPPNGSRYRRLDKMPPQEHLDPLVRDDTILDHYPVVDPGPGHVCGNWCIADTNVGQDPALD